ncbi:restriction endonuclease subunit S [Gallibacterium anatis]|uniref:restriction endonuclease subunit S n=1 Tax=Gallibacterium anatis TaxID=750 RepID=UPI0030077201
MSNIPKLRFPEFTDAWEKCKLGEVIINHSSSNYIQEAKAFGEFEVIQQGNTPIVGYSNEMPFENFENVLCFGDHTTSLYKPLTPFLLATDGVKILSIKGVQGYFILSFFERYKPNAEGYKRHFSILKKQQGYIPPLPEQQKIGNLFKQLDRLITLHKRKWDDVILLKKALLQKMFPKNGSDFPEIRFPEFTDAWEKWELGDLVNINSGKDYKHLSKGNIPVYGTGGYMLSVNEALSYGEDAIGIGRKGTIDKPYILKAPFWTVDTLFYAIPYVNYDLNFIFCIFQITNWKEKDESTGVPSLSKTTISKLPVRAPTLLEQQKIGNLFKQLDRLITLHKRQHEHYQLLKKALLQQMFV